MVTKQQKGIFFVVMGTLLFSSKAIIVKMLFQIGLGALELQTLRMLLILPFYLGILYWTVSRRGWGVTNKDVLGAVLAGVACYHIASYLARAVIHQCRLGADDFVLLPRYINVVCLALSKRKCYATFMVGPDGGLQRDWFILFCRYEFWWRKYLVRQYVGVCC
jgi:hypothetical protein